VVNFLIDVNGSHRLSGVCIDVFMSVSLIYDTFAL